ncbi:SMI1/KNR4 family protein [Xanthocytophaga agilis]|uniref:SMI1/KNR4 family protein n=1 Tax=Xanthocytophaga agilis TaxID=3048010 RepID=A0AAE3R8X1_9BACT|nr:SMI1/KNR4 family protein [Xanthocytophaga agilis]MDJ1503619.1 SMI1/KNR4 family protein [Xanthocytophaga agilis]
MKELLQAISKKALLSNSFDFSEEQIQSEWLGFSGASDQEIEEAERRLQINLPQDYKDFLKISNGFSQTTCVSCTFLPTDKIDYLKVLDDDLIDIWNEPEEVHEGLAASILIGGLHEEQYFLLIPPHSASESWSYWKFASWIPGEEIYDSLKDFFTSEYSFLEEQTKGLEIPTPRPIVDYSLRDAVFDLDWNRVYSISLDAILEDKHYPYSKDSTDLFALLLIAAGRENRFSELTEWFHTIQESRKNNISSHLYSKRLLKEYEEAATKQLLFAPEFHRVLYFQQTMHYRVADIEKWISQGNKNLLKEKNKAAKIGHIFHYLNSYDNIKEILELYESAQCELDWNVHLKAAVAYATIHQISDAKYAVKQYFKQAIDYRPLEPFLIEPLLPILDKELLDSVQDRKAN